MKILIDARPLQTGSKLRGIGRYVNLLIETFGNDNDIYFLFFKKKNIDINVNNIIFINSPRRGISYSDNYFLPKIFKKHNIEIYHSTIYALPRKVKNVKYLITFHDITPIKYPEYSTKKNLFIYKKVIKSMKYADKIIAVSEKTKSDLISITNLQKEKIKVVYHAIGKNVVYGDNPKESIRVPKDYLLYVGGFDGNKNVETIFKAVNIATFPLVIVGQIKEIKKNELLSFVDIEKKKNIFFTGYISDEKLQILYKNAKIFLFPSLYEGFGFPPLEALAFGTPSVVSDRGSLPEIMKDAALYCKNVENTYALSEKIIQLWNNKKLRNEIARRGKKLLKNYMINDFKKKMEKIYMGSFQ